MRIFYFTCPTADRHVAKEMWEKLRDALKGIAYIANPFYYQNGSAKPEIRQLDAGGTPRITNDDIVEMDLELINMATHGIIAFLSPHTSHGSAMELWEAYWVLHRPVFAIGKTTTGERGEHPWIAQCTTKQFDSVYELIKYLRESANEQKD